MAPTTTFRPGNLTAFGTWVSRVIPENGVRSAKQMVTIKDDSSGYDKANKAKMKIPKDFNKIPGSKILGNPVPKNPGIPGFGKISSQKIPGLKFLIPLGPGDRHGGR